MTLHRLGSGPVVIPQEVIVEWIRDHGRFQKSGNLSTHGVFRDAASVLVIFAKDIIARGKRQAVYWFTLEYAPGDLRCGVLRSGSKDTASAEQLLEAGRRYLRSYRADVDTAFLQLQRMALTLEECRWILDQEEVLFDVGAPPAEPQFQLLRMDVAAEPQVVAKIYEDGTVVTEGELYGLVASAIRERGGALHTPLVDSNGMGCVLLEMQGGGCEWFACEYGNSRDPVPVVYLTRPVDLERRTVLMQHAVDLEKELRRHAQLLQRNEGLVKTLRENVVDVVAPPHVQCTELHELPADLGSCVAGSLAAGSLQAQGDKGVELLPT